MAPRTLANHEQLRDATRTTRTKATLSRGIRPATTSHSAAHRTRRFSVLRTADRPTIKIACSTVTFETIRAAFQTSFLRTLSIIAFHLIQFNRIDPQLVFITKSWIVFFFPEIKTVLSST